MKRIGILLLLVFLGSFIAPAFAQEDDKYNNIRKRDYDQKDAFDDGEYLFPPQPKNNWSIGVKGGLGYVAGDVKGQPGMGFALDVRRAMGHTFSLRLQAGAGQTKGQNYGSTTGYRNHVRNPWDEIYYPNNRSVFNPASDAAPIVFYNYRMRYADLALQGVIELNNINFYKEQSNWHIYAAAGIGGMAFTTSVDALDAQNQPYEFFPQVDQIPLNDVNTFRIDGRKQRLDLLRANQDGTYETPGEGHQAQTSLTFGGENYTVNPFLSGAAGIRLRLSRRVELELEHRISWSNDDLLDGNQWSEVGFGGGPAESITAATRDFDSYNHTTLGIHFRLGKGEESLWWTNPLTDIYSDAKEARETVRKLTEDTDSDGVPDLYDKEPDTPEGTLVDNQGRTLDSDGDGYPDVDDDQPFSPKGAAVDGRGVALDSDNDGVPDIYDKEPNSPAGMYYDAKGVAIQLPKPQPQEGGSALDVACLLPIIYFDLDRDEIKPEFYPELYYIAQVMKANPAVKIRATGHADVRNTDTYNEDLSKRRVENTINFIANTYGIERSRFMTQYKGEKENVIKNLPETRENNKLEPLHYVNRRVEFECVR
jgi:outer membrane protein OmpA-like peptidoglycan-associated protein